MSSFLVSFRPFVGGVCVGCAVAELRAERHEIAKNRRVVCYRPGRFNRDVLAEFPKSSAQLRQVAHDHRFPAGYNDVLAIESQRLIDYRLEIERLPLGIPRSIGCVAKPASQVASTGSDKNARRAGKLPFTLNTVKYFGDSNHATETRLGFLRSSITFIPSLYRTRRPKLETVYHYDRRDSFSRAA